MKKKKITIEDLARMVQKGFEETAKRKEVDKRFDGVYKRFDGVDKRFDGVDKRFLEIDKRFDDVDKRFLEIDKRFDDVDKRFDEIKDDFVDLQTSIDAYANKADTYFQEMVVLSHKVDRHEKWMHQIAEKLGIKLEY